MDRLSIEIYLRNLSQILPKHRAHLVSGKSPQDGRTTQSFLSGRDDDDDATPTSAFFTMLIYTSKTERMHSPPQRRHRFNPDDCSVASHSWYTVTRKSESPWNTRLRDRAFWLPHAVRASSTYSIHLLAEYCTSSYLSHSPTGLRAKHK